MSSFVLFHLSGGERDLWLEFVLVDTPRGQMQASHWWFALNKFLGAGYRTTYLIEEKAEGHKACRVFTRCGSFRTASVPMKLWF